MPTKYTFHGGVNFSQKHRGRNNPAAWKFSPNVLIMLQGRFTEMNLGFYAIKNGLTTGAWFRQTGSNSDAIVFLIGHQSNSFKFGYSYDVTVSSARSAIPGSHKVSFGYTFCSSRDKRIKRSIDICPAF